MDEFTLNDLLECSVCLERLDTSSKVLPCQHTFCRKCLLDIIHKHKELRCPECRILVQVRVDELPPNVLLMRLLEGMKNSGTNRQRVPKVQQQHQVIQNAHSQSAATVQQINTPDRRNNKQSHLHHPCAKALFDYESNEQGDLAFKKGDLILIKKRIDQHWYEGEFGGNHGLFPLSYVQIITPLPSNVAQCKALFDFQTDKHEEEGCLVFKEGDIINVIRRVDENWAEGNLEGRVGIFPLTFVELNSLARSLMKLSTNAQPGPSRVAPPTPTSEESTPLIPTDHSRNVVQQNQQSPHNILVTSDSSSTISSGGGGGGSSSTPNVSSSNTSSNNSTAPSSPASPPPRTGQPITGLRKLDLLPPTTAQQSPPPLLQANKEKRHSFTGSGSAPLLPTSATFKALHRLSAEISAPEAAAAAAAAAASTSKSRSSEEFKLPAPYVALYPYKPQKGDELELKKGAIYMVTERCQDGWFKGTSNRTQKCGVFPGNYVTAVKSTGTTTALASAASFTRGGSGKNSTVAAASSPTMTNTTLVSGGGSAALRQYANMQPPELPPRASSPAATGSNTPPKSAVTTPMGRSTAAAATGISKSAPEKPIRDRKERTVSLMRRLTSMKRSKSPPSSYSMDNPVFEDVASVASAQPLHVRSGSCPSQLLQTDQQPHINHHHRLFASTSQRIKHKENRPTIISHSSRSSDVTNRASPEVHHHRKSNSLDAGNRSKTGVQTVHEVFRCEIPYPPNSEYELELQKGDLIYVHKKRDDGWYKGTLYRSGRTGLFPASFVKPA